MNVEEEVAEDALAALGDAGVAVEDEVAADAEPDARLGGLLVELDEVDLADGDAGDLDARADAEAGRVVEDRVDAVRRVAGQEI